MLRKCYQAEILKNRHSAAGKLTVGMPFLVILFSALLTKSYLVIDGYNWWYTGLLPAYAALAGGVVMGKELGQKNRNILTLPVEMEKIWDGKVLYGIRMLAAAMGILFTGILLAELLYRHSGMEFSAEIPVWNQLAATAVLFTTSLWQVPFCLFLRQICGGAAAPLIHVAGYVGAAVTISLKPYFMLVPGAVSARLMCSILGILPNGLVARPGSITWSPELAEPGAVPVGIISSLIWLFLFWITGRWWFGMKAQAAEVKKR